MTPFVDFQQEEFVRAAKAADVEELELSPVQWQLWSEREMRLSSATKGVGLTPLLAPEEVAIEERQARLARRQGIFAANVMGIRSFAALTKSRLRNWWRRNLDDEGDLLFYSCLVAGVIALGVLGALLMQIWSEFQTVKSERRRAHK